GERACLVYVKPGTCVDGHTFLLTLEVRGKPCARSSSTSAALRDMPRTAPPSVYVALSRATGLDDLNLPFPVTLQDLNQPQNQDIIAIVTYLHRLDE
ncbi:unnamed protein product, partial [Ectocarpus sp. 13 AM-2016]